MKKTLLILVALVLMIAQGLFRAQAANAKFQLPAVSDIAMYQVNPRVFAPSNSLNAVAARIDSISALGVNVMWVMPIYPIGKVKSKNSPYSISDYKAIAPEFGTINDLKHLVQVCHEHGMGIILDWVANHTAWDNVWMKDHKDWYTQDENGNVIYPAHTDWTDVADLNYDNREMRAAMVDAMKFWIVNCGIDGFRCDVADGVPADFWKEAIDELRKAAGNRDIVMLAEGSRPDNFTVGGFDMNYGWAYKSDLVKVWKGAPAYDLFSSDRKEYEPLPKGKVKMRFTTNHDQATQASTVTEFTNQHGAMAAYVATIFPHGGALIYGSQEVGYDKTINFFKYVPVDWTAHPEVYREYQKLIGLYNKYSALRKGELIPYPDRDVMAFMKTDASGDFLVLVNVRNAAHTFDLPQQWAGHAVNNVYTGKSMKLASKVNLKPFQYFILKAK